MDSGRLSMYVSKWNDPRSFLLQLCNFLPLCLYTYLGGRKIARHHDHCIMKKRVSCYFTRAGAFQNLLRTVPTTVMLLCIRSAHLEVIPEFPMDGAY